MTIELDKTPLFNPLRNVRGLTTQLVEHFVATVPTCRTMPSGALGGVTTVTRMCVEIAGDVINGHDAADKLNRLSTTAARWAHDGVPIDSVLHAFHEGLRLSMDLVDTPPAAHDPETIIGGLQALLAVSDLMCATVTQAYLREQREVAGQHHSAVHTLTTALLAGRPTSTIARECGIAIEATYSILALSIPAHTDKHDIHFNSSVVARRKLRRVQAALARHGGERALALLSVDGGTLLLPTDLMNDTELDALVGSLSHAAKVDITAAFVLASTADIPDAARRAHELLDMVQQLGCAPKLYRFDELALEYQLTRPGPARDRLSELLAPLDGHPELNETLRMHIANNMNRQRTARLMHIHTNTVDYRLRRVAALTGLDPSLASDMWQLRSVVIARSHQSAPPRSPPPAIGATPPSRLVLPEMRTCPRRHRISVAVAREAPTSCLSEPDVDHRRSPLPKRTMVGGGRLFPWNAPPNLLYCLQPPGARW